MPRIVRHTFKTTRHRFHYNLQQEAKILHLELDPCNTDHCSVWILADEDEQLLQRNFAWIRDHEPFNPFGCTYVGTVRIGMDCIHLFEVAHGAPEYKCVQQDT